MIDTRPFHRVVGCDTWTWVHSSISFLQVHPGPLAASGEKRIGQHAGDDHTWLRPRLTRSQGRQEVADRRPSVDFVAPANQ
jgi:hypothetical protein